ncbi:MAG: type II secretion system protein GspN [Polyangia bacterium]
MSVKPAWRRALERLDEVELSPRTRQLLRIVGYPVFAVVVAIVSFSVAVPRDKVRAQLEAMLSQDPSAQQPMGLGMDVKAGDLDLSLLGSHVTAENVVLRTRPLRATDKPARFVLDRVKVGVGIVGAMLGRPTYSFLLDAFSGELVGSIATKGDSAHYTFAAGGLKLEDIQGLQSGVGGLPLEGTFDGKLDLDAPGRLLAQSNGTLELDLDGAALGDGKAKLVIPGDPFLSAGVTVPKVRLGKVNVVATIEKGKAKIDSMRAHSADMDLTIEGFIDLRDPISLSSLHLFLRFRLSDDLLKRDATLGLVTTGLQTGRRADGFYSAQITGSLASPRFEVNRNPPPGVSSKFEAGAAVPAVAAPAPVFVPAAVTPPPVPTAAVEPTPIPENEGPGREPAREAPPPPPAVQPMRPMPVPVAPLRPPPADTPHAEEGGAQPPADNQ